MKGELRLCPQCGSASVDFSSLSGGAASCRSSGCKWVGVNTELVVMPFAHDLMADDSMALAMVNDLRQLLAGTLGLPYLKFLMKWGFLQGDVQNIAATLDRKKFARYIVAISTGIMTSVLAERAKQDASSAPTYGGPN